MTFAAATMMAGVLLAATACAGPAASEAPAAAAETPAAETASPAATPAEAPSASTPSVVDGMDIKGPANNGKGDYLQTTIADDHPDMSYDAAVVDPAVTAAFSPEDIVSAHKHIIRFIAEEGIDSTLNDGDDITGWMERNIHRVLPELREELRPVLESEGAFVASGSWDKGNPKGHAYKYDANKPRVTDRSIKTTRITLEKGPSIVVDTVVDYVMPLSTGVPVNVKGTMLYGVSKDEATGGWFISGQRSNYTGYVANR